MIPTQANEEPQILCLATDNDTDLKKFGMLQLIKKIIETFLM